MTDHIIEPQKLSSYLLNPRHVSGGPKCELFLHFGFMLDDATQLALAIREHAQTHRPTSHLVRDGLYLKRVVKGPIATPSGRTPQAISVWEVMPADRERLITAYIREA